MSEEGKTTMIMIRGLATPAVYPRLFGSVSPLAAQLSENTIAGRQPLALPRHVQEYA